MMCETWKDYFVNLYDLNTEEWVAVNMCGFNDARMGAYFLGEPVSRTEVEVRVKNLKL